VLRQFRHWQPEPVQNSFAAKHSQYSFRHRLFLHLQFLQLAGTV
jgi:hypothetical protein